MEIGSKLSRSEKPPLVIGVAGGTGSGKTTVARELSLAAPAGQCIRLEHDWYYKDQSHLTEEQRAKTNYDHPDSLETSLLVEHLKALRQGKAVQAPVYDFVTHTRAKETRTLLPTPVVVVEGILILADPQVREQLDIQVFVDTDADIRVLRRIERDLDQRGRSFQSVCDQYYRTVRPMHLQFVEPSKRWADLIIPEGGENRVALEVIIAKMRESIEPPATQISMFAQKKPATESSLFGLN